MATETRATLLKLLDAAIDAARPEVVLPPFLPAPPAGGRIVLVGAGKAAAAMALATERHYHDIGVLDRITGEVATRHGYGLATSYIPVREAGHPVPDAASVAAADRALSLAAAARPGDLLVVLLSGGASAIWAAPVAGVTLGEKQALTRALLKSGETIHALNTVRKHMSRIKGGRLARATSAGRILTLAISDVPGDDPAVIGSGPTVPDPSTLAEARAILARLHTAVPASIIGALASPANESPKPGDPAFAHADFQLVAAPKLSIASAAQAAQQLGYRTVDLGDAVEGEARVVAKAHAVLALAARSRGERVAFLSGGELTVTIRGQGRGGPNQEYALALAVALDGVAGIAALAADTDGADGGSGVPDDPAGALVLPDTLDRARDRNLNAVTFLDDNDSTGFFGRLGDLIVTGPTRTNVNDFRVILIDP
jgi:hydroxypyruvate reductase